MDKRAYPAATRPDAPQFRLRCPVSIFRCHTLRLCCAPCVAQVCRSGFFLTFSFLLFLQSSFTHDVFHVPLPMFPDGKAYPFVADKAVKKRRAYSDLLLVQTQSGGFYLRLATVKNVSRRSLWTNWSSDSLRPLRPRWSG